MGWAERDICRLGYKELRGEVKEGVGRGRLGGKGQPPFGGRSSRDSTHDVWVA